MTRNALLAGLDLIMSAAKRSNLDKVTGQGSLFAQLEEESAADFNLSWLPDDPKQLLAWEKEYIGMYISGHPCDPYAFLIDRHTEPIGNINANWFQEGNYVTVLGSIETFDKKLAKKSGNAWALMTLEDTTGSIEVLMFSQVFDQFEDEMREGEIVIVSGILQEEKRMARQDAEQADLLAAPVKEEGRKYKLIMRSMESAQEFCESWTQDASDGVDECFERTLEIQVPMQDYVRQKINEL